MEILQPSPEGISRAAAHLLAGGLVGLPTETVYGLAADLADERAVAAVFEAKDRPRFDPLIAHVAPGDPLAAAGTVADLPALSALARERLSRLLASAWPGPLTVVLPRLPHVTDLATAGLDTVAVRMPAHPVAQAVLRAVGRPLVAPSANRFGRVSPTTAAHVVAELGDRVPYVLDGGPCAVGVESTVVAMDRDGALRLLRPGGWPVEAVERSAGASVIAQESGRIEAPGQTASHYAPARPVVLLPASVDALDDARLAAALAGRRGPLGLLFATGDADRGARRFAAVGFVVADARTLAPSGDAVQAAHALFASLRALDQDPVATVVAEPWTGVSGLGHAVADRLRRAAAKR